MPIIKKSEDYVDYIYEEVNKKYDIYISKRRIRKILRSVEMAVLNEIMNGHIVIFGPNQRNGTFVYQSMGSIPMYIRNRFTTVLIKRDKLRRRFKDPIGAIKDGLHNRKISYEKK